jgi:type IX secretion system PorP/SprF family membrane protein
MKNITLNFKVGFVAMLAAFTFNSNDASAQQDAQYSMYMFNPLSVNPAYAGSREALSVTMLGRKQWVGIDGAPSTATLSIHSPLRYEAVSLGLSVIQDEIGPTKNTSFYGDLSYRINVSKKSKLAFGLKGGLDMFSANFGTLRVQDGSDIQYTTPIRNQIMPNFGFGLYLNSDKYYVGLTAPKIIQNEFDGSQGAGGVQSMQNRHFFLTAGRTFKLSSVLDIIPSFVVKAVEDAPLSADINVNFMFYDKLWIGGGYRFDDSFIGNIVYHFTPQFRAGYAYDYSTSDLGTFNTGTHEVMINYDLDFLGKGFRTPRRF